MFTIIAIVVLVGILYYVFKTVKQSQLDAVVEKVETQLSPVVEKVEAQVKSVLDVNKDGKVTLADAVEAGKKVAKKSTAKKPAAKKAKSPKLKVAK